MLHSVEGRGPGWGRDPDQSAAGTRVPWEAGCVPVLSSLLESQEPGTPAGTPGARKKCRPAPLSTASSRDISGVPQRPAGNAEPQGWAKLCLESISVSDHRLTEVFKKGKPQVQKGLGKVTQLAQEQTSECAVKPFLHIWGHTALPSRGHRSHKAILWTCHQAEIPDWLQPGSEETEGKVSELVSFCQLDTN